jgi:hypothetical protein
MSNVIDTIKKKQIIKPRTEVLINAIPDFRHTQNTALLIKRHPYTNTVRF